MKFINKLERKFGKYAISNLMYYIIILYGVGFLIARMMPQFYWGYLSLDVRAILHGQIWRIVTFLIYPPSTDLIFIIFSLYLYYILGVQLERQWGAFRFNLYFFSGVLFHVIAGFVIYFAFGLTGITFPMTTHYLNLSLFLAFAAMFPDLQFLLFFIIPIKAKHLAIFDMILFAYEIYTSVKNGLTISPIYFGTAVCAIVSLLNFFVFYMAYRGNTRPSYKEFKRQQTYRREVKQATVNRAPGRTIHKCAICGRTENDGAELEFRFCSRCNGNYEYCQDHLFTHEHVK